jgi:hypothetical protein
MQTASNFHFKMSDLIYPNEKCINPDKNFINYNPHNSTHFLLLQDYFPAVDCCRLAQIKILHLYDCTEVAISLGLGSIRSSFNWR